jgi:hypothetical protein
MILRIDRLGTELPPPSDPDPDGAAAVQELMIAAVFNGPHPETGEPLEVVDGPPEGALPRDRPPQPAVFAPDYAPEEIAEIAARLREAAGLGKEPTGRVAEEPGIVGKVADKLKP